MKRTRKLPLEKRGTIKQRSVSFTKRKKGLFNKAAELCMMCDAQVAIMATSVCSKDKVFSFGHSCVDAVFDAFLNGSSPAGVTDDATIRNASSLFEEIKALDQFKLSTLEPNHKKNIVPQEEFSLHLFEPFEKSNSIEELQRLVDMLEKMLAKANSKLNNLSPPGTTFNSPITNDGNSPAGSLDIVSVGKSDDGLAIEVFKPHKDCPSLSGDVFGQHCGINNIEYNTCNNDKLDTFGHESLLSEHGYNIVDNVFVKENITDFDSSAPTINPKDPEPDSVFTYHSNDDCPSAHTYYLQNLIQSPYNFPYSLDDVLATNNAADNIPSWTPLASAPVPGMTEYFIDTEFADYGTNTEPSANNFEFNHLYVRDRTFDTKPDDSAANNDFMNFFESS